MWKIPRENWSIARTISSFGDADDRDIRVSGGRRATMALKGDSGGQSGSSAEKAPTTVSWGFLPASPVDSASSCWRVTVASAMQTRVRPQTMAMRQSSGASHPRPLVRLGRFSPVSKTSRAASQ